jgi:hypothetical protein
VIAIIALVLFALAGVMLFSGCAAVWGGCQYEMKAKCEGYRG